MFDHNHYVPILRGKLGEYGALSELPAGVRDRLTPLIEIPPVPIDWDTDGPSKTISEHVRSVPNRLESSWGVQRRVFVDLPWLAPDGMLVSGSHPLAWVTQEARQRDCHAVPVTAIDRDDAYQQAVQYLVQQEPSAGCCLRLQAEAFRQRGGFASAIESLLETLGTSPETVDLVIDLRHFKPDQVGFLALAAESMLGHVPHIQRWRTLTLAGGSFPPSLGDIGRGVTLIERAEWILWRRLVADLSRLPRVPTFGDYGISHPDLTEEVDPRFMRMSANLRYTAGDGWLVFKKRDARTYGFEQFHEISAELVARPEFAGAQFSWGDGYLDQSARRVVGPGNATTWRKIGTNHHLTLVTDQIAS